MILEILTFVAIGTLVTLFWKYILDILNGPVRDLLEQTFGANSCGWYVSFLMWADQKVTATRQVIKMQWQKFKDTIVKIKSVYRNNGNGKYTKTTETITRTGPTQGRRIVMEETVDWSCLPNSVRAEMIRQKSDAAELDVKAVAEEKIRQRGLEEGIELVA